MKAVTSYHIAAGIVLESKAAMEDVSETKRLHFYWTQCHKSIEGNEIMDEIEKNGVRLSPENVVNIRKPLHILYDDLDRNMARKIIYRLNDLAGFKAHV